MTRPSLICTPRNAVLLSAYQQLKGVRLGPFKGQMTVDQFEVGLPYVYEARVIPIRSNGFQFRIAAASDELLELINAGSHDVVINDCGLNGLEAAWVRQLSEAWMRVAPVVGRFSFKDIDGRVRQFENLAMPLMNVEGDCVATIIGGIDEVGVDDQFADAIDWEAISAFSASRPSIPHPVDL